MNRTHHGLTASTWKKSQELHIAEMRRRTAALKAPEPRLSPGEALRLNRHDQVIAAFRGLFETRLHPSHVVTSEKFLLVGRHGYEIVLPSHIPEPSDYENPAEIETLIENIRKEVPGAGTRRCRRCSMVLPVIKNKLPAFYGGVWVMHMVHCPKCAVSRVVVAAHRVSVFLATRRRR